MSDTSSSSSVATSNFDSPGSATARHSPKTAAASSPEFAQITAENYATSQKGLFEQEVGKVTYSAADRELDLLQEVLLAVAMKYVSWRLAEKGEKKVEAHQDLENTWKAISTDRAKSNLLDRYRRANPAAKDSFKNSEGLASRIYQALKTMYWPALVILHDLHGADKDLHSGNPFLAEGIEKAHTAFIRDWTPQLVAHAKRDSPKAKKKAASSATPTGPKRE